MKRNASWPLAVALTLAFSAVQVLHAGTLDTQVIALFPKDVGEFAYVDMETAQQHKWFPELEQQILPPPFREFVSFLKSAGIDPDTQVGNLAFAAIPANSKHSEEVLGVAEGDFQRDTVKARLRRLKLPTKKSHGYTFYIFGSATRYDILFFFLDSNTAVFGQGNAIEQMLSVRLNGDPSLLDNNTIYPLIDDVNGQGVIWAVLNQQYTQLGLRQLLPEVASTQQSSVLFSKIRAMTISVDTSFGVETQFEAVCGKPEDANNLAALLQAGILYRRYQASQSNPELAKMLDEAQVTPRGDRLDANFHVTQEEIVKLIEGRTFRVRAAPKTFPWQPIAPERVQVNSSRHTASANSKTIPLPK